MNNLHNRAIDLTGTFTEIISGVTVTVDLRCSETASEKLDDKLTRVILKRAETAQYETVQNFAVQDNPLDLSPN